ncbi:hypothetical protein T484DRAFT_1858312 [Baffinella frigidus]|nr:hypothetical protein T484DRAFT_1858312 [Cryptophyta sp. CCMP2293]
MGKVNALISVGSIFVTGSADGSIGVWAPGGARATDDLDEEDLDVVRECVVGGSDEEDVLGSTLGRTGGAASRSSFFATPESGWGSPHAMLRVPLPSVPGHVDPPASANDPLAATHEAANEDGNDAADKAATHEDANESTNKDANEVTNEATHEAAHGASFLGEWDGDDLGGAGRAESSLSATGLVASSRPESLSSFLWPWLGTSSRAESRSSFFATPDLSLPQSPHAALAHLRSHHALSPMSDLGPGEDTWTLSPDPAPGPRRWRCQHRVDVGGRTGVDPAAAAPLPGGGQILNF